MPSFTFTISNLSFIAGDLMYSYKYNNLTQSVPSYCLFPVNVDNNRWFSFNIWLSVNSETKMFCESQILYNYRNDQCNTGARGKNKC